MIRVLNYAELTEEEKEEARRIILYQYGCARDSGMLDHVPWAKENGPLMTELLRSAHFVKSNDLVIRLPFNEGERKFND